MKLNEEYNVIKKIKIKNDGGQYSIAYIDPKTSDSLYGKNDILKRYGAKADTSVRPWLWFWFIGDTPEEQARVINTKIKPCLTALNNANGSGSDTEIIKAIDSAIERLIQSKIEVEIVPSATKPQYADKNEIKDKLLRFKEELVQAMSDQDFKSKLAPILKFRNAQGHKYSLLNTILIWIQDPNATLVKSRSNWLAANKEIIPNARAISMWVVNSSPKAKEEQQKIIGGYLKSLKKKSTNELTITEREELKILLKDVAPGVSWTLVPAFYDISQTKQIEGKEDLVGSGKADLEWYTEGMEDERVAAIYSSLLEFAKEKNITVSVKDDLGGARGSASATGEIDILQNSGKDVGLTKTLAHEISHQLLHWDYVASRDPKMKEYFVGVKEGRAKVEQQAEVSAWIVMKNFDFDLPTSINYIAMWGSDEKSVVKVFDEVAKVANILIEYVENKMKTMRTESETLNGKISGLDVAKLFGKESVYLKYQNMNEIKESFYKTLKKIEK